LNIDVRERWSMAEFLHPCNSTFKCWWQFAQNG
jgi:hypothetical protein